MVFSKVENWPVPLEAKWLLRARKKPACSASVMRSRQAQAGARSGRCFGRPAGRVGTAARRKGVGVGALHMEALLDEDVRFVASAHDDSLEIELRLRSDTSTFAVLPSHDVHTKVRQLLHESLTAGSELRIAMGCEEIEKEVTFGEACVQDLAKLVALVMMVATLSAAWRCSKL